MKLQLDTHLLLWAAGHPDRLSVEAGKFIDNHAKELFFTAASLWEVVIKRGFGRDDFKVDAPLPAPRIAGQWLRRVAGGQRSCGCYRRLTANSQPFDRVLVAQATVEGITLLTTDALIAKYSGPIRTV